MSWDTVDLGRLDVLRTFVERYGPAAWYQVYQVDVFCRGEHLERVRRPGEEERTVTMAASMTYGGPRTCDADLYDGAPVAKKVEGSQCGKLRFQIQPQRCAMGFNARTCLASAVCPNNREEVHE